ncbi:hypothetical protein [Crateriforma conspicua]|uniref:Uncharacterized protein n=1 Tax=Crateriforma conspicua TaxID=2527996 RepID=A0A5C6FM61_9PLAN|nr:hypothetical protein [Crateriforma conspicua]TWU62222.1 hypothetical protein V7x_39510 [Crateriforma conspicua]
MTSIPPYTTDTSVEAEAVQLELFRQMTPAERLAKMCSLTAIIRRMAFDAIRRTHPDLDDAEVRLKFIESTYGEELAAEVRKDPKDRQPT